MVNSRMRKAGTAAAAAAAIGGIAFAAQAVAAGSGGDGRPSGTGNAAAVQPAAAATAVRHTAPKVVVQQIAHGTVDGTAWSVALEYHATLPAGYHPGKLPGAQAQPKPTALLCQRMVIGGVRIDHQGGSWADCQGVSGAHDPRAGGEEGLWGLHDKGTTGSRLFVANPEAEVAYGVVTLADGTRLKARAVAVPHTDYRAWAVAIPDGRTIAAVDQYDAGGHRLSHETEWR